MNFISWEPRDLTLTLMSSGRYEIMVTESGLLTISTRHRISCCISWFSDITTHRADEIARKTQNVNTLFPRGEKTY